MGKFLIIIFFISKIIKIVAIADENTTRVAFKSLLIGENCRNFKLSSNPNTKRKNITPKKQYEIM